MRECCVPKFLPVVDKEKAAKKVLSIVISAYTAGETCCRPGAAVQVIETMASKSSTAVSRTITGKAAAGKAAAKKAAERHGQARHKKQALPEIPDKLYYRIGEVARLCGVETYVLRFWETEFPQLKPNKSGAGQRLYRRREVDLARRIRHLLYEEGYTIPGARQHFQAEARKPAESGQLQLAGGGMKSPAKLGKLRTELKEILGMLSTAPGSKRRQPVEPSRSARRESKAPRGPELFD
jgi:DNA-binding transcriptional MerR regulator